jgi:CheY-like chemotaxis protein
MNVDEPVSAERFSPAQNDLLAGPVRAIVQIVESLADTPLTPEQHECVYRLRAAARVLETVVRQPEAAPLPARPAAPPPAEARACSILLLDGSRKLAQTVGDCLRGAPHRIDHCVQRSAALALLRERRYDLVLADPRCVLELPAVLRAIQADRGDRARTAVIALQARDAHPSPREVLEAGFDARLAKPVDRDALVRVLGRYSPAIAAPQATPAVRVMRREFLSRALAAVDPARQALAAFDARGLVHCADLVSAALPLGFDLLARAGSRLRSSAHQNDWMRARQCVEEIAAEAEMAARAADIAAICGSSD